MEEVCGEVSAESNDIDVIHPCRACDGHGGGEYVPAGYVHGNSRVRRPGRTWLCDTCFGSGRARPARVSPELRAFLEASA
jgi:hypothetical protein